MNHMIENGADDKNTRNCCGGRVLQFLCP